MIQRRTIGIIGAGNVGIAAAYAIFLKGIASEIILVDKDKDRARGEAMDLMHGQAFVGNVTVRSGDYEDLRSAQLIVISAGVGQKPGETRIDLLNRNAAIFRQIISQLDQYSPESVIVIASNPVDILTYVSQKLSQRETNRIVGTGTMLDTGRFRSLLGQWYGVDPRSVHAYIVGEHGDSEVPLWSTAQIGGLSLLNNPINGKTFEPNDMNKLFSEVKNAAYEIINRKGYTDTAIGSVVARLSKAILEDEKTVFPVSVRLVGEYSIDNVCLSLPSVMGIHGVESKILVNVSEYEHNKLIESAEYLKSYLMNIRLD